MLTSIQGNLTLKTNQTFHNAWTHQGHLSLAPSTFKTLLTVVLRSRLFATNRLVSAFIKNISQKYIFRNTGLYKKKILSDKMTSDVRKLHIGTHVVS